MPPTRIAPTKSNGNSARASAHDVRVVLAVDEGDRLHECVVTSDSMRAVYFSKAQRLGRELDDLLLAVERVLPPDVHVRPRHLDEVVAGPGIASETERRDGAGVDDEEVLEPPRVRHVLVAREDEVDAGALQALDDVARVVDDVPLATRARDRQQVVVQDEDPQVGGTRRTAPRSSGSVLRPICP